MKFWEEIVSLFERRNVRSVVVLCHSNADPDAVSSALSLRALIHQLCATIVRVEVVAEGVSEASSRLIEAFADIEVNDEINGEPDAFILVDANNVEHVGKFKYMIRESEKPLIVIDHHVAQSSIFKKTAITYIDEDASSTAEIISLLNESVGRRPSVIEATILLIGVIYDSKRFLILGRNTFHAANFLITAGADYDRALLVLSYPIGRSERIARLKAAQRTRLLESNGWIIASSIVSSFEASACRGLIELGADAAIVSSDRRDEKRISTRSTKAFHDRTGINLAKIMEKVGEELNGSGGGHATAATVSGISDIEKGERLTVKYIEECVRKGKVESMK
ncbi:MAG: DHH family phosphoesterase [Candidatus Atabeyarchaeum deiterrae]